MNTYLIVTMVVYGLSMWTHIYRIAVPDWKRPRVLASALDLAIHVALLCWTFALWLRT